MRRRLPHRWWVWLLLTQPTRVWAQVDLTLSTQADPYLAPMASTLLTYASPLLQLVYVVAALVATGQGYQVWHRWNAGELTGREVVNQIWQWAGALILLVSVAYALDLYITARAAGFGYQRITHD